MPVLNTNISGKFTPLRDGVLVRSMKFSESITKGGIIVLDDNALLYKFQRKFVLEPRPAQFQEKSKKQN